MRKTGGRIVYEDGLEYEEYEDVYEDPRQPLVLRASAPPKQSERVVYQQAPPQYIYVYEGEEEYEDGELYYTPAPSQDATRPAIPIRRERSNECQLKTKHTNKLARARTSSL